ncbi:hypothetical protein Hanom_Chr07g00631381 [Helianthus anomalus]
MFGLSDLNVLYGNKIHVGAGNENLEEGMLFQRPVERAWERKREMMDILTRITKQKERKGKKHRKRRTRRRRKKSLLQTLKSPHQF